MILKTTKTLSLWQLYSCACVWGCVCMCVLWGPNGSPLQSLYIYTECLHSSLSVLSIAVSVYCTPHTACTPTSLFLSLSFSERPHWALLHFKCQTAWHSKLLLLLFSPTANLSLILFHLLSLMSYAGLLTLVYLGEWQTRNHHHNYSFTIPAVVRQLDQFLKIQIIAPLAPNRNGNSLNGEYFARF